MAVQATPPSKARHPLSKETHMPHTSSTANQWTKRALSPNSRSCSATSAKGTEKVEGRTSVKHEQKLCQYVKHLQYPASIVCLLAAPSSSSSSSLTSSSLQTIEESESYFSTCCKQSRRGIPCQPYDVGAPRCRLQAHGHAHCVGRAGGPSPRWQ